jgi:hypothetical protein
MKKEQQSQLAAENWAGLTNLLDRTKKMVARFEL